MLEAGARATLSVGNVPNLIAPARRLHLVDAPRHELIEIQDTTSLSGAFVFHRLNEVIATNDSPLLDRNILRTSGGTKPNSGGLDPSLRRKKRKIQM